MIESRYASSSGISFSSAIFKPSFGRFRLINAVVRLAIGSRSMASNAGRKKVIEPAFQMHEAGESVTDKVQERRAGIGSRHGATDV